MPPSSSDRVPDWDIFCQVVDNFGDIGVCWRLSRALTVHYGHRVRLWVDDWMAFAKLCPQAGEAEGPVRVQGVEVHRWRDPFAQVTPAAAVVEAFACALPESFVAAMAARRPHPLWINLEYLSAEPWVSECHGLASPHPRLPLVKHFFFPGFGAGTGGLLCEPGLLDAREKHRGPARTAWLEALGVERLAENTRLVSLFSYEQPALPALLARWAHGPRPVRVLVPEGRIAPQVAAFFGATEARAGDRWHRGALSAQILPFSTQDDYDRLLWSCDLNFVRGEDSFVRAQWAAAPFVWHIYPQSDAAHWAKLDAFFARYREGLDGAAARALEAFWRAWNGEGDVARAWDGFEAVLPEVAAHNRGWAQRLASGPELAASLVQFRAGALK